MEVAGVTDFIREFKNDPNIIGYCRDRDEKNHGSYLKNQVGQYKNLLTDSCCQKF